MRCCWSVRRAPARSPGWRGRGATTRQAESGVRRRPGCTCPAAVRRRSSSRWALVPRAGARRGGARRHPPARRGHRAPASLRAPGRRGPARPPSPRQRAGLRRARVPRDRPTCGRAGLRLREPVLQSRSADGVRPGAPGAAGNGRRPGGGAGARPSAAVDSRLVRALGGVALEDGDHPEVALAVAELGGGGAGGVPGVARPLIDFLREAPLHSLLVHCPVAPTQGSRWQNCGASLEARISAHGAADEILLSHANGCMGFSFEWALPSGNHRSVVNLRVRRRMLSRESAPARRLPDPPRASRR